MTEPIACRLGPAAAADQLGEWRTVLAATAVAAERPAPAELAFRLRPDLARLDELVRLAQREKDCCPFFSFGLGIEADTVVLRVSVPEDAVTILDGFARMVR